MRLRHRLPPQSRLMQSIPSWVDPEALLAMQFGPDRYWRKRGGLLPATSVLTTTRSSVINLPDNAGVYQPLGNNVLPRTDRGLYGNGQVAALNENGNNPQSATGWATNGATITNAPDEGIFKPAYVASSGPSGMNDRRGTSATLSFDGSTTVAVKIRWGLGLADSGTVQAILSAGSNSLVRGTRGAVTIDSIAGGPVTVVSQSTRHMDLLWTPNATAAGNVRVGPYTTIMGGDIKLLGIDITNTPFVPAAWVSTGSPAPTLLASDIRAVQGVRPSNAQPEPFPGWEAAGLDDGFTVLVDFENRPRSATTRVVWALNTDANDRLYRLETTSAGTSLRGRGWGEDANEVLDTPLGILTGRNRVALRAVGGAMSIAQQGSGSLATGTVGHPVGLTRLFLGNNATTNASWDDWIYSIQITSPLSDDALLEWVNT